jgi:predicted phage terminase large subunit-like protein
VLRTYYARLEWSDQVAAIQKVNVLDKPRRIFIESNGYQLVMAQEQMRQGLRNIRKIKRKIDKVSYANKYLTPKMKNGQVFLRQDMQELVGQLEDFPDGEHDDLVDGLAGAIHGAERQVRAAA